MAILASLKRYEFLILDFSRSKIRLRYHWNWPSILNFLISVYGRAFLTYSTILSVRDGGILTITRLLFLSFRVR